MVIRASRRPPLASGVVLLAALCAGSPAAQVGPGPDVARDASREQWQMPVRVMDEIGVGPGMTVADVGAGDGWFSFYLAERVGSSGRVIAEDIDAPAMNALREQCAKRRVSNISVLVGEPEDPRLPPGSVDVAVMVNVLTALGSANAGSFLGNLARGLKPGGRLVLIDWDPVKLRQTTASQFQPELRRMLRLLEDARFEVVKTLDFLPRQSFRVCQRR